ncbi:MAG: aryl-sulfate sulfotransferase [bacterium]
MKISLKLIIVLFITTALMQFTAFAHEAFYGPTETNFWDESKAYNGYTLFGVGGQTYLIDMEGNVAHSWKIGTNPRLTPGGTIIDAAGGDPSKSTTWQELDWNGNIVWKYSETRAGYSPHHDFEKIYNPKLGDSTFIYIANKSLTLQQCLEAGADSANSKGYSTAQMDAIVEVDMAGNIIWEWSFFDHIVQDIYPTKPTYGIVKDNPGKININLQGNPLQRDWLHCNSLDYNEELDLIVINSVQGEFYVIDHGNTFINGDPVASIAKAASTTGDFLYRFGDPARYDQGDPPSVLDNWTKTTSGHKQIGGAHNIQWIKPGLPGAGNFLIFNNSQNLFELTPQSYILEINPYLNSAGVNTGKFVNPPLAGYNVVNSPNKDLMKEKRNVSKQIVWSFSSKNNVNFYSTIGSSAQRLPNGNTLVCSDNSGHFFEICPKDTTIVWEYINPLTKSGFIKVLVENYPMFNSCFRAYRYTADYPGLKGKDLTATKTITGRLPSYYTPEELQSIIQPNENLPDNSILKQNFPNPFNPNTTIGFDNKNNGQIKVLIYDTEGNVIKKLADGYYTIGSYELNWDGTDNLGNLVQSGTYFYSIQTSDQKETKKMIIIK